MRHVRRKSIPGHGAILARRSAPMTEREYLLGTGDDELTRLALQNRLWGDVSAKTFRRAQLKMGHRALDVG